MPIPGTLNDKRDMLLSVREMPEGASSTPMFELELDDEHGVVHARLYDRNTKKLAGAARVIPLSNVASYEEATDAEAKTTGARGKRASGAAAQASEDGARSAD